MIAVADLFCGAGGSTTGLIWAADDFGIECDVIGANHWDPAIASWRVNHPGMRCVKVEIEETPATEIFGNRRIDILWASPECKEFSYAKGGKSIDDRSRVNAFSVPRHLRELHACGHAPGIIIVENVMPFVKWGPIEQARHRNGRLKLDKNGEPVMRPIASRKGEIFRKWFAEMQAAGAGYKGEWRAINAGDHGEAQSRVRFIAVFTAPGIAFAWPEPTHDREGRNGLPKWVGARKIIDFSLPSETVFGRKKPLSVNTLARIAAGMPIACNSPLFVEAFMVVLRQQRGAPGGFAPPRSLDRPAPTLATGSGRGGSHTYLAQPSLMPIVGRNQTHNVPRSSDQPAPCLTTAHGGGLFTAQPTLRPLVLGQHGGGVARGVDDPVSTISRDAYVRLFEPYLVKVHGSLTKHETPASRVRSLDKPSLVIATNRHGTYLAEPVAEPVILSHGSLKRGQEHVVRARRLARVAPTVQTRGAGYLVDPRIEVLGTEAVPAGASGVVVRIDNALYLLDIRFRQLHLNELKQLQGLGANYALVGTKTDQTAQIGNAVPVKMAHALGCAALRALGYSRAGEEQVA